MFHMFRRSLDDFKVSYKKYLSFALLYSFFTSVIFMPFLMYLFNRLFMIVGKGEALLNSDVYMLGLSFQGLLGLFVICFIGVAVLFVEFGVLIIIAQESFFKRRINISEAFVTALFKLPKLLGLGIFQLSFLLLLSVPFLDASTLPSFLDLNIQILWTDILQDSLSAKVVYSAVIAAILYVYMRWIYALHFIFIENKTIWNAMKASWTLTRRGMFRIVFSILLWNTIIILTGFLLMTLISQLAIVIDSKAIGDFIANYLLTFSSYFVVIMSWFILPINIIMLTRMFHKSLEGLDSLPRNALVVRRIPFLNRIENRVELLLKRGRAVLIPSIIVVMTGGFIINYVISDSIVYLPWHVEVAGHKGDGFSAPENSMSSIQSAISKGVDAVEIDVTLTKDDIVVLSHDQDLKRIADIPKNIRDLTYEELKDVDIGRYFDDEFIGEKIPKLDEVLEVAIDAKVKVIIDVKTDLNESTYAQEIVRLIEEHDAVDLASVQSFNHTFLTLVREQNSEIDIGQILYLSAGNLSGLDVDFYTVRASMLTERFIKRAQKENRKIWVWTVNSERNIKEVLSYDIDGIITDYPERVQRILGVKLAEGEKKRD